MAPYPRIPDPPSRAPGEPAGLYGTRLFRWCLETECPGVLDTSDLELADYAGAVASTTRGYSVATYDRLSRVRHAIAACLQRRAVPEPVHVPATTPDTPARGTSRVPVPAPVRPLSPAGQAVDIPF